MPSARPVPTGQMNGSSTPQSRRDKRLVTRSRSFAFAPHFSDDDRRDQVPQIDGMFHQIYFHIVWTTRDRRRLIDREVAVFLDRVLRAIALQERARILELGMVATHVHLVIRAHPMTTIPRLLQRLKGASSALAGKELGLPAGRQLRWAPGYTIQSVSRSMLDSARDYVRNQPARHPHEVIAGWVAPSGEPGEAEPGGIDETPGCIEETMRLGKEYKE